MATVKSPTLQELLYETQRAAGLLYRAADPDAANAELTIAQVAYHAVKAIDTSNSGSITQEQADRICAVIATRIEEPLPLGATSRDELDRLLGGDR